MVVAKKFIYANRFVGEPKLNDFNLEEETLPAIKDGDVLVEALYLSVDPYMRPYMDRYPVGVTMIGEQVGRVIESKSDKYPVGTNILAKFGWRTQTIFNSDDAEKSDVNILPPFGERPLSLGLGCLGMPGSTAYFGLLDICRPKSGDVVAVTGAAGAVGSLVGQIAKIKGCKVIGFAGTDDKCSLLRNDFGFDYALNYKKAELAEELRKAAPDGIDCYFDNVGGELSSLILKQMRDFGRIAVCGSISSYNLPISQWPKVPIIQPLFVMRQLTMEGFIVTRYRARYQESISQLLKWIDADQIKYKETVTIGFENMPRAFIEMLRGGNTGKAVIKCEI